MIFIGFGYPASISPTGFNALSSPMQREAVLLMRERGASRRDMREATGCTFLEVSAIAKTTKLFKLPLAASVLEEGDEA